MDALEASMQLERSGYTRTEAWQILRYVAEERRIPSSRKTAPRLAKAQQALRDVGIEPDDIDFYDWPEV